MRMNEPAHAIREQHIHFLWFYDRGYFAFAECGMYQRLALPIRTRAIVWRTSRSGRTAFRAGAVCNA